MRLWFVSEVFDPAGVTTGYYLARIAEALAHDHEVRVITDNKRGAHDGPRLEHLASSVGQRGFRALISSCALAARAVLHMRPGDIAVAATNPPALPILMALVSRMRGTRLVIIVHDVYPDVLVAAQVWRPNSSMARLFDWLNRRSLASADRIVVIGLDMQDKLNARLNGASKRIAYIPNWANEEIVATPARELTARPFIVQYSGNMGLNHGIETLIESAALLLPHRDSIHLEVIGWGLKLPLVQSAIAGRGLRNITLMRPVLRSGLGEQLARCDIALIVMNPGTSGASVPCRLYNIMAAGRPVIVAADRDSEIATVVRDNRIGWIVEPAAPQQLAEAILNARAQAHELPEMGRRAQAVAREKHSFQRIASEYAHLIEDVV